MKKIPESMLEEIKKYQNFLILLHKKPDGDAIGSAVALGKGLKNLNKSVDYYVEFPIEDKLSFFDEIKYFNQSLKESYDIIFFLDCSTLDFSYHPPKMPKSQINLVIDHHKSNRGYGDQNYIEITGATAEIIFRVLKALDAPMDEEIANAIFTGISSDTGSFQFSNVTVDTHFILSQLYAIKDDFSDLSKRLHGEKSFNQFKITGEAIHSLKIIENLPIAMMILSKEALEKYGGAMNISDDVATIGQNIPGILITALLKEVDFGEYRVSLRARAPYDIHELALKYHGGGHARAAGFNFSGEIETLKKDLFELYHAQIGVSNVSL